MADTAVKPSPAPLQKHSLGDSTIDVSRSNCHRRGISFHCNEKWKSAHDRIGPCLGYRLPGSSYRVIWNATEEDQWSILYGKCGVLRPTARVFALTQHVLSVLFHVRQAETCKQTELNHVLALCRRCSMSLMCAVCCCSAF